MPLIRQESAEGRRPGRAECLPVVGILMAAVAGGREWPPGGSLAVARLGQDGFDVGPELAERFLFLRR